VVLDFKDSPIRVTRQEGNTTRRTTNSADFRNFLLVAQLDPEGIRSRIREARKAAGLTQSELADALEVHKRTVENYERFRTPDYRMLNRIATVTNRPLEWFLHGAGANEDDRLGQALAELQALRSQVDRILEHLEPEQAPPQSRTAKP